MNTMTGHRGPWVHQVGLVVVAVISSVMNGCTSRDGLGDGRNSRTFIKGRDYSTRGWGQATGFTGIDAATLEAIRKADRVVVSGFVALSKSAGSSPWQDDWGRAYDHASLIARYLIEQGVRQERLMISSGGNVHPVVIDRTTVENRVEVVWYEGQQNIP